MRGRKFSGHILSGGADWQIMRADRATDVQARYSIETDGGGLILVTSDGLRHGPLGVLAAPARGDAVDPAAEWLNRILAIAPGAACGAPYGLTFSRSSEFHRHVIV